MFASKCVKCTFRVTQHQKKIYISWFFLTFFFTSPIFNSKRQFRNVLGSKAALLEMPLDLLHIHTSKRTGAYFQVFCTLRLAATSETVVFTINSSGFLFHRSQPKHHLPDSCGQAASALSYQRWEGGVAAHNSSADCCPKVLISNAHNS